MNPSRARRSLCHTPTCQHHCPADSAFLDNPYTYFKSPQLGKFNILTQTDTEADASVNCGIVYLQVQSNRFSGTALFPGRQPGLPKAARYCPGVARAAVAAS
jgi:hypothetical protein